MRRALWRKQSRLLKLQQRGLHENFSKLPAKILMHAQFIVRQGVRETGADHSGSLALPLLNPCAPATSQLF